MFEFSVSFHCALINKMNFFVSFQYKKFHVFFIMGIQGYIDEIVIYDERVNGDTIKFYELLGLETSYEKDVMKLLSTRRSIIKSFDGELVLKIGKSHCNKLYKLGILTENSSQTHILYDNIGTKVIIMVRMPLNYLRIGVLTSGGDAPGMNSAVRSIIRTSLKNDIKVFGIYRGYEGLICGDIRKLGWKSETEGSGQGGTFLLTDRSEKFRSREGRKEAAFNLLIRKITSLIVIGGDGSMSGAMTLKEEYEELCKELIAEGRVTPEAIEKCKQYKDELKTKTKLRVFGICPAECPEIYSGLESTNGKMKKNGTSRSETNLLIDFEESDSSEEFDNEIGMVKESDIKMETTKPNSRFNLDVIGIPGTIDNDVVGIDFSLGSNTALTRIMEVVEKLNSTMRSHKRTFILECMGRDCGWLTLMAGFAVESDCILLPECLNAGWEEKMAQSVKTAYSNHNTKTFVFVSEGARDSKGEKISIKRIKDILFKEGISARSLTIGHIQRGGMTCAFDRILGTLSGIKAVNCIISRPSKPELIGMKDGEIGIFDLKEIVKQTSVVRKMLKDKRFDDVLALRDKAFQVIYKLHNDHQEKLLKKFPSRQLHHMDNKVGLAHEKLEVLIKKNTEVADHVSNLIRTKTTKKLRIGILRDGMSSSGMNSALNSIVQVGLCNDCEIFYFLDGYDGIINLNVRKASLFEFSLSHNEGGAFIGTSQRKAVNIEEVKKKIERMGIDYLIVVGSTRNLEYGKIIKNLIIIPACIENNFPGTRASIGSDTALNMILSGSEPSRLMALNTKRKIFIVEIGGKNCGYLTIMGGIACGVFEVIYPEECHLNDLIKIKKRIKDAFERQKEKTTLIFRNHNTFDSLPTDSICRILCSNTNIGYDYTVLGNIQRGITPTGIDRINARVSAFKAIEVCLAGEGGGVIGTYDFLSTFTPLSKVLEQYDQESDTVKNPDWLKFSNICSSLE